MKQEALLGKDSFCSSEQGCKNSSCLDLLCHARTMSRTILTCLRDVMVSSWRMRRHIDPLPSQPTHPEPYCGSCNQRRCILVGIVRQCIMPAWPVMLVGHWKGVSSIMSKGKQPPYKKRLVLRWPRKRVPSGLWGHLEAILGYLGAS